MNPFLIWSSQCRRLVSEIFPQVKIDHSLFSKNLGVWWKTLSVEEKNVFRIAKKALDKHHAAAFPDYKYRPEKKATKEANKKLETCTKTKPNMRRKSQSKTSQPQQQQQQNHQVLTPPVEGITVSGPPANLVRAQLQRKQQPKQNMRKNPGMRRDLSLSQGVCYTAVNINDPTPPCYSSRSERSASREPAAKRLSLRPTEEQKQNLPHNTIDPANPVSASTVLPTAGNSPHPLVTPATRNESALRSVSNTSEGHQLFNFIGQRLRFRSLCRKFLSLPPSTRPTAATSCSQ
ncbi:sex-determining region Y protein [Elysia marginata]|uniref:Sex-determining region Y protein n=1 Tax=Elysia marginata TaxID=1093978 RepID=A0AAV4J8J4_9GAST|nr:sex-determining region Y protein [Elysia marginata]